MNLKHASAWNSLSTTAAFEPQERQETKRKSASGPPKEQLHEKMQGKQSTTGGLKQKEGAWDALHKDRLKKVRSLC